MKNSSNFIDPTYLRAIHDGLFSGAVHKDNLSGLPIGLVGIYQEALSLSYHVNERRKFLEFFTVWALLKKEVSAEFVVPLLEGWTEEQVIDYISQYSKWFNSPVSGKYVLYHERLRNFVLQKVSAYHFEKCNEAIITDSQMALQNKAGDEWKRYALEHLSTHLLTQAMKSKDASALKALAYNTSHWNRQIEISKGFEWSKRMLNDMMLWASKYDDEEVVECALNKVDLFHLEQNDTPQIVELVANNDMDTALQRIEAFGGNNKEGLQRKFILYMLCLMELTLLESKDKPFCKAAIEKLLKHLDENLPVDHSVLNWGDFFPSYLMILMTCEWSIRNIDFNGIYNYTNNTNYDWLNNSKISLNNLQIDHLRSLDILLKNKSLTYELIKFIDRKIDNDYANNYDVYFIDEFTKIKLVIEDSKRLYDKGFAEDAKQQLNVAFLKQAEMILNEDRILLLRSLSQEYCKQGYESKSDEILQNIYEFITFINDKNRDYEITNLVDDYIFNNQIVKAELLIKSIEDPYYKMYSILKLLDRWKDQKNLLFKEWYAEIFNCLDKIDDDFKKGDAQSRITEFIFKQYGLQDAINYAVNINGGGGWYRDNAIGDLAIELIKIDDIKSAIDLVVTNDIIFIKASEVYMHIFKKYVEKEDYNSALNILELIVEIDNKNECTLCLLNGYLFVNNFDGVYDYLLDQIKLKIGINDKYEKLKLVRDATEYAIEKRIIDFHLLISNVVDDFDKVIFNIAYATSILEERNSGKIDIYITKAIESIKSINSDLVKDYLKSKVVELYIKLGWFKDALEISKSFNDKTDSLKSIIRTHDEYFNSAKDWVDIELLTILEELHVHCLELDDIGDKFSTLSLLSNFALNHKQDKLCYSIQEKLKSIIYTDSEKSDVAALLAKLSTDIHKMGRFNDSFSLMEEALMTLKSALKSTEVIDSELYESSIDIVICELFNQGHWALAENTCLEISQIANRHRSWNTLAKNAYEEIGWKNALQKVNYFQRPEAKTYFLKGLADSIDLIDANKELILKGRYYYQDDIESMEKLMQQYALNELFFKNATPEKIQRFNRTLKIQWALDIKNQFTYTTCK